MATTEDVAAPIIEQPPEPKIGKQLALFEGKRYPNVDVRLTGGVTGDAEFLLPEVTGLKIGQAFQLVVDGVVVSKKHALTYDKDGEEVRTLVVTLKVDRMGEPDE